MHRKLAMFTVLAVLGVIGAGAAFAGQPIADVIDASQIEVTAKLSEQDRANVAPGQTAEVAVDALPDAMLRGTVRTVSGVASRVRASTRRPVRRASGSASRVS